VRVRDPRNLLNLIGVVAGLTPRKHGIDEASQESGRTLRVGCGKQLGNAFEQLGCERVLFGEFAGRFKAVIGNQQSCTQRRVASPVR
jgi:hypothetical protein